MGVRAVASRKLNAVAARCGGMSAFEIWYVADDGGDDRYARVEVEQAYDWRNDERRQMHCNRFAEAAQ
jgi:hypothetical protein